METCEESASTSAGTFEAKAEMEGVSVVDLAVALAGSAQSSSELEATLSNEGKCDAFVRDICEELKNSPDTHKDASELNFAFFTSFPGLCELIKQSMPAIWLTQMLKRVLDIVFIWLKAS